MRGLVIICTKDGTIDEVLLEKLTASIENSTVFKRYTTNLNEGASFEIVTSNVFFDMVEENKFIEFHSADGEYYGTPHIHGQHKGNLKFMLNSVENALEIKKYHWKAITVYVLPQEDEATFREIEFKWHMPETKAKLLDFLVTYSSIEEAVEKIRGLADFMKKNAID